MQQKVEMLELQIKESHERYLSFILREASKKKMQDAILKALSPQSENSNEEDDPTVGNINERNKNSIINALKHQVKQLKKAIEDKDTTIKELTGLGCAKDQELERKEYEIKTLHKTFEEKFKAIENQRSDMNTSTWRDRKSVV